jgi:hypothetical protein
MEKADVDPKAIFLQAQSFHTVRAIVEDRVRGDPDLMAQVGFPVGPCAHLRSNYCSNA